jgi:hypothetical protein
MCLFGSVLGKKYSRQKAALTEEMLGKTEARFQLIEVGINNRKPILVTSFCGQCMTLFFTQVLQLLTKESSFHLSGMWVY